MVSGKPSQVKILKSRKNLNLFLVFLCLTLVFLGKLDLVAIRNIKSFFSKFKILSSKKKYPHKS